MLVGFLTGHIHLYSMLHKMRRAKTTHVEDVVQKRKRRYTFYVNVRHWKRSFRIQTLGFARMDLDQVKEARLSSIVVLGKGA